MADVHPYNLDFAAFMLNVPVWCVDLTGPIGDKQLPLGIRGRYLEATLEDAEARGWADAETFCDQQDLPYLQSEWQIDHKTYIIHGN
jgi:hypothetical protein